MYCRVQRRAFLVDSGADVSVFPATPAQMKFCSSAALQAANGTSISTFGKKTIKLSFAGLKVVHTFLLADVKKPILGTDFFRDNDLIIDISRRRLFLAADSPTTVVEVRARPATFAGGLCGLRLSLIHI